MPEDLRRKIEKSLEEIGEVDFRKHSHHGSGPMRRRVLPPEDLVHDKAETIRQGQANRVYFRCSNPMCQEPIRSDRWETHVLKATSDLHLQEPPEEALERRLRESCAAGLLYPGAPARRGRAPASSTHLGRSLQLRSGRGMGHEGSSTLADIA